MIKQYISKISDELDLTEQSVDATVKLLGGGATVPFIARYRKEATGSLDETKITSIRDRLKQLLELDKRRDAILESLTERKKLTKELKESITAAVTLAELEDIYLPYRPKRRTRATVAKEKGLEPLAELILKQDDDIDPLKEGMKFVDHEKGVESDHEAVAGARDIIAEWINEDKDIRSELRDLFLSKGDFISKVVRGKDKEGIKFKDYFEWRESVQAAPSHRVLAMRRGEKEGFLMLRILPPEEDAHSIILGKYIKGKNASSEEVQTAALDSYKRLLTPPMENEIRMATKKEADAAAIQVFANNLRQLLMSPPLGQKRVLAVDPGFRTGCKLVCLDDQGKLLVNDTIYPFEGMRQGNAGETVKKLCDKYKIEYIAIGNGTASRETESFVRSIGLPKEIQVLMVSESGASIYSASEVAREEFPDHDVTVRGAVSIGRRLMDPLAELVKIDPKSIGVGQYQHDVDQELLRQSLDDVVMSCVNSVGVEVNTASKQLLMYVSGIGPTRAQAIMDHRDKNGPFACRDDLKAVSGLGDKAYEQAAGFLRIQNAENVLDCSAVHPESYWVVDEMAARLKCKVRDLMTNSVYRNRIDLEEYVSDKMGLPTLEDIIEELAKPGRDPRDSFEAFQFKEDVHKPDDLKPGMVLPGIVTNVTNFGAFVDVGVHLDGLVHISEMSDKFVKSPEDVVSVHQKVKVTVLEVDLDRNRIALSMRKNRRT